MQVIPKRKRLKAYKYALTRLEDGMCISLADSIYGVEGAYCSGYLAAPWTYWDKCKQYFPELKGINCTKGYFTPKQRHEILTKAIELCTPSKSR